MVCKRDEVLTWFKGLKSYKRTDLMCSLLNLCLPFELRFLGTCLEHLGKRDFHELRQSENEANSLSELNALDLQCLSNQQVRTKLAIYVSLLYSCNYTCSNSIFKILTKSDDIHSLLKKSGDDTVLDELLLIYTLAINHPAFSFEQKLSLEKIFSQLLEEERLFMQSNARNSKTFTASSMEPIHDKSPLQGYSACIPLDDAHIIGVPSPSQLPMAQPAAHHPVNVWFTGEANTGVGIIGVHDGANGGLRLSYSVPPGSGGNGGGQGPPLLINPWGAIMTPVTATVPPSGADSPIGASRTSSPCNSASRPGSPHQQTLPHQPSPPQQPQPPQQQQQQPPQQQQQQQHQPQQQTRLKFPPPRVPPPPSAIGPDHLREAIGKEMPKYITNLQSYSNEQLSRMSDEDLREIGLNQNAIIQLRSILNKQAITNGIGPTPQIIDMSNIKKKVDPPIEHEYGNIPTVVRRYPVDMAVYPGGMMCPPMSQCYSCYIAPRKCLPLPHYQVAASLQPPPPPHHHLSPVAPTPTILTDPLRSLRLDTEPSSASDTASDHSPPDTPAPTSHLTGASIGGEQLATGEERLAGGGGSDERRGGGAPHGRARGIGRNRSNPPGIQKLPRGRGPNPVQRRREIGANMSNGGIVDDRKVYSSNNNGNGSNGGANNGSSSTNTGGNNVGGGAEPPAPTGGYFTSYMSPYIRPAGYPSFHHPGFVRPTYPPPPYHNGDIVYPYPPPPPPQGNGPQGPPQFLPGPPQPPYSPAPPPQPPQLHPPQQQQHKLSCYNCGSQSHIAVDCPEATIEEITKQGQYKIDFTTSYQKQPGEIPNSADK
ncbi:uncharacterized protein isoform X1 [Rhodnius prolixus]|uniref:uncharacterized protein isoform X1 n=1 Tax=Rhodnius prolixus TaxID=13249 RepID=UPI003D187CD8